MKETAKLSPTEIAEARERRLVGMHLQRIEGNPLTVEEVEMFEMFEREAWPDEKCRAYILAQSEALAAE